MGWYIPGERWMYAGVWGEGLGGESPAPGGSTGVGTHIQQVFPSTRRGLGV